MSLKRKVCQLTEKRLQTCSNGKVMSKSLSEPLAERLTPWLLKTNRVTMNGRQILLTSTAEKELDYLSCALRWMENADRHHSQQVSKFAGKVMRAISRDLIACEEIFKLAGKFQKLRKKAIDSNNWNKDFAKPQRVTIATGAFADRLISASEISHIGHAMRNCLANPEYGPDYVARARRKEIKLFALYTSGKPVALLSIAGDNLEELKGPANCRPVAHRLMLVRLLEKADCKIRCNECPDAARLAICNELLHAKLNGSCRTFKQGGTVCEVGPGFLAIAEGSYTALLQSTARSGVRVTIGTDHGDVVAGKGYLQKCLRQLCQHNVEFAEACFNAFSGINVVTGNWRLAAE